MYKEKLMRVLPGPGIPAMNGLGGIPGIPGIPIGGNDIMLEGGIDEAGMEFGGMELG